MTVQIIDNVEIGDVPATPNSIDSAPEMKVAEESLLSHVREFGHPIAYIQEQNGKLIQHVFPIRGSESDQISSSSKVDLELHTETAFHPYKPDYVLLLCLRGEPEAKTTFVCMEDLLGETEPEILYELTKDDFMTSIDKSFRMNGEEDKFIKTSVLQRRENGTVVLNYDSSVMFGTTPNAQHALDELKQVIGRHVREFTLSAGQLAIIDNSATIHGRTHFTPRYDGTDRWLLRCMVRENLAPEDQMNGNVIITTF